MTKEQAIKELRICECYSVEPSVEALDMAIKALEQQPSEDAISRQAVNEYLEKLLDGRFDDFMSAVIIGIKDNINALPPVTPTFPKGTTNGDMIKAMFPKIEIYTDVINEIVDVEICEDSSELRCSIDWWNAPYKRGDIDGSN